MKCNYIIKTGLAIVLLAFIGISCSEIPDGFIPDEILYVQDPFNVQKGVVVSTAPPNVNGASYPLYFKLLEAKAPDGSITSILTDSVLTRVWTAAYDYNTDKTIEDIYAKLDTVYAPVMQISDASGQIMFTSGSSLIPSGQYKVSVQMSNSAGVRKYENVFTANIIEGDPYWVPESGGGAYSWNSEVGSWGVAEEAFRYEVTHNPTGPNQINVIVCDKNGNAFDWSKGEVIIRGDRQSIESLSFDPPIYKSDRSTYRYPFSPFPFAPGGPTQYNNYYRIPAKYISYDNPVRSGFCNIIIGIQVFKDGEWTVKLTHPVITRK